VLSVLALPFGHRVLIRYFLFALPVYLLTGAYGLVEAGRWLGRKLEYRQSRAGARRAGAILAGVLIVGLFAAIGMPAATAYYRESKQNWRGATRLILAYAQPGDQIFVPDEREQTGLLAYARQMASVPTDMDRLSVRVLPDEPLYEFSLDSQDRGWLVVPFRMQYLPDSELDTALGAHRFFPPLVVSVDPIHMPEDWESIAITSYSSLALIYFEPSTPEGKICQPADREKFQTWLLAAEELDVARVNTDLSLGLLAYYCGDMEEAHQRLSHQALSPGQDLFITWLLGNASQELGRWDEAIHYYRQVINISPNYAWLEVKIGNIYRDLGEFEQARVSYLRALETNDDQDWPHSELANLYEQMGRPELALQEYQRASALSSQNTRYMIKVGQLYAQLSDFEEAKNSYQQAIDLEPDNGWYYTLLASVYASLGEPNQAVKTYEKALALNPAYVENSWFQLQLANGYRLAGQRDEAIVAYEQVLSLDEDNAAARKGLQELRP
jgi:tetratricopeptide (TPR) repeat protein